ncbi:MAG TPA: hypothetical protein VJN22_05460 [Candidatus Eremiobacteraceae bacterium]|nr:hypothetical protein [Candidatus Eremiobacteraceae bacterium]
MRPPPLSDTVRHNIVRRLGFIFAASILVQFGVYAAFVYAISAAAALAPTAAHVGVGALVLVVRIIITLPLGFFAARYTYRALRRAAPPPARMAAQPAVVASAAAACMMILSNLGTAPVLWSTVVRDVLAAALWIFAAYRALRRAA